MILGATHWVLAGGIAVAIHLAGVLWLSLPESPPQPPLSESMGDELIVTLGRNARARAQIIEPTAVSRRQPVPAAAALAPASANESVPLETPKRSPASVAEAHQEAVLESDLGAVDVETVTPASPPPTAQVPLSEAASTGSREVTPRPAVEVDTVKTASVAAREAAAPVQSESAESVAPAESESVARVVESSPSSLQTEPAIVSATQFADAVLVPTVGTAGDPVVRNGGASPSPASPVSAVKTIGVVSEPLARPLVERPVRADTANEARQVETVAVRPADSGVEVAVARARRPEVEVGTTQAVATAPAARPETIDLEDLQQEANGSGVVASYAGRLKGWLKENMHYPRAARLAGQEGRVVVRFVIDRAGRVQSIVVESESGYPLLDREAREMIERGDPFPEIPPEMPGEQLEIRVPVSFNVRDETLTKEIPPIYLE